MAEYFRKYAIEMWFVAGEIDVTCFIPLPSELGSGPEDLGCVEVEA